MASGIVRDAACRLRRELGVYRWHEWADCLDLLGMSYVVADDRLSMRAVLYDDVVILKHPQDPATARAVWHEIGHKLLHAGNSNWWLSRPGGHHYLTKLERQANEFAVIFPVWE